MRSSRWQVAINEIQVATPSKAVWEVLADARLYAVWVVGSRMVRHVEGPWPDAGSVLHHTQAPALHDSTTVLESVPHARLVLLTRVRPLLITQVTVELGEQGFSTQIRFVEEPVGGLLAALSSTAIDGLLHVRNLETVRRLKHLAEIGHQLAVTETRS
jgi:uncharacterized protein YndB with AHSA1/START domain